MSDIVVISENNIEVVEVGATPTPTVTVSEIIQNVEVSAPGPQGPPGPSTGITGGISTPTYVQFDTTAVEVSEVGKLTWNDTDGTLEFGLKGGNVTLQIGQEQVVRVRNTEANTITDGQAVYITGSTGSHLNVLLAQANGEATSSKTLAVVTEHITHNSTGFATTSGLVRDLNTSALTEGAAVWLSATTPGGLTTTRPSPPNHAVLIGWCVRQHASNGVIFVHIQNGYELDELHDIKLTNLQNGQALVYDAAQGLWVNGSGIATALSGLSDVAISSVGNGDVLSYNSATTKWANEARILLTDGGNF